MNDYIFSYTNIVDGLESLANAYLFAGHMDEAVHLAHQGLEILEANQAEQQELIRGLLLYGTMLNKQSFMIANHFDKAVVLLERAQNLAEQPADLVLQASVLMQLGMAHDQHKLIRDEGDYETAMGYFQKAMQKFEQANDQVGIGRAFFNIGLIHQRWQQREEAEVNFSQALEIAQQQDEKLDMSLAYRHRGFFHTLEGEWDIARYYAEESLRLREEIGCRYLLSPAHHVLGLVHNDMGDKEAALSHYYIAFNLAETLNLKLFMLQPLFALSDWHQEAQAQQQARTFAQRALDVAQELNYRRSIEAAIRKIEILS
ncbi:MAG: tetratricopeptide repeat protein [Chloroflexota bacterium]